MQNTGIRELRARPSANLARGRNDRTTREHNHGTRIVSRLESPIQEASLHLGDLLIICTDGVIEAPNANREEYGEGRLIKALQENRSLPVRELLTLIQENVQEFSGPTQADDITAMVARCH